MGASMTYPCPRSLKRWRWGTPAWKRRLAANNRREWIGMSLSMSRWAPRMIKALEEEAAEANGEAMLLHGDNDRGCGHYYYAPIDVKPL